MVQNKKLRESNRNSIEYKTQNKIDYASLMTKSNVPSFMVSPRDKANTQRVNFMSGMESGGNSPIKLENVSDCVDGMGEDSVSNSDSSSIIA